MNRRTFLAASTAAATTTLAGCFEGLVEGTPRAPPTVADRPDAVYVPSHIEGMEMVGTATAGDYEVGLMYSYPHRFWNITGSNLEKAAPAGSVHLMASVWDPDTRTVLPVGNAQATVEKDGETIVGGRPMWPMLSQNMGFHFGDNFALDGDGTYDVTVGVDPLGATATGGFAGQFADNAEATFTLEYSQETRDGIRFRRLDDRQGERSAISPMNMEMLPISRTPARGDLPGDPVGQGTAGDAVVYARHLDAPPEGFDGEGRYLYVSPRSPYNGFPLPFMAIEAAVSRDGSTTFEGGLEAVVHPEIGYHYAAAVEDLAAGDEVALSFGAPPQVARHEGYETAFLELGELSMTVP